MTSKTSTSWLGRVPTLWFLLIQAAVAYAAVSWAAVATTREQTARDVPEMRNEPIQIGPLYDMPMVVSDEQLRDVLYALRPKLAGSKPSINYVDHALRCWGLKATFDDPACLSGKQMQDLLLNHRIFAAAWGSRTPELLIETPQGTRTRVQEGKASSSHYDHTLAGLAEIGTSLDHVVVTKTRQTTVRSLLRQSLRDFSLNQVEYEWSALAYALYMPTDGSWTTTEGQQVDFDRIANRLMRERPSRGVCFGNHRLHSLVMMLRVDEQQRILSEGRRAEVLKYLQQMTAMFVRNQETDGSFSGDWSGLAGGTKRAGTIEAGSLEGRLLATGHVLEWWALAPAEVLPPREVIVRAGQWTAVTIGGLPKHKIKSSYTYLTHAARALALWRGREPWQVDLQ